MPDTHKIAQKDLTSYSLLKEHFSQCTTSHFEEMKAMGIHCKEVLPNLRRVAFEYYHNGREISEMIRDILGEYEEHELVRSQLAYYPVNLDSIIANQYEPFFAHSLFLTFFLS